MEERRKEFYSVSWVLLGRVAICLQGLERVCAIEAQGEGGQVFGAGVIDLCRELRVPGDDGESFQLSDHCRARLETRTKESNWYASMRVRKPVCGAKARV